MWFFRPLVSPIGIGTSGRDILQLTSERPILFDNFLMPRRMLWFSGGVQHQQWYTTSMQSNLIIANLIWKKSNNTIARMYIVYTTLYQSQKTNPTLKQVSKFKPPNSSLNKNQPVWWHLLLMSGFAHLSSLVVHGELLKSGTVPFFLVFFCSLLRWRMNGSEYVLPVFGVNHFLKLKSTLPMVDSKRSYL